MTTSLQPGAGFVAVHGVLDAARTLGEVMPLLASRIGCDVEGIELAARSAADVVRVPADARRPGPDLRAVADTALLRAGGEGPLVFRDRSGPIALAVDGRAQRVVHSQGGAENAVGVVSGRLIGARTVEAPFGWRGLKLAGVFGLVADLSGGFGAVDPDVFREGHGRCSRW